MALLALSAMELHASTNNKRIQNTMSRHFGAKDNDEEVPLWDNPIGSMVAKYRTGLDRVLDGLPPPILLTRLN